MICVFESIYLPNINLNKVTLTQILKSFSDPIRLEIVTKLFKESNAHVPFLMI